MKKDSVPTSSYFSIDAMQVKCSEIHKLSMGQFLEPDLSEIIVMTTFDKL